MQPMMAGYHPHNVTTDLIQQYLDENKSLILKIVESQHSGKLSDCAENQARLQRNLMYLAAIADSQPQSPTMHSQFAPSSIMQPAANYLQHQQAQKMTPEANYLQHQQAQKMTPEANYLQHQQSQKMTPEGLSAARSSLPYSQQQQQPLHSHLALSSGRDGGFQLLNSAATSGGGSGALGGGVFPGFDCGATGRGMAVGNKQEYGSVGRIDGQGWNSGDHGGEGCRPPYLKAYEDGN